MFARSKTLIEAAAFSDYLRANSGFAEVDYIDATLLKLNDTQVIPIGTDTPAFYTIDLNRFTQVYELMVWNQDPTNYVTLTYRSAGNAAVNNIIRIFGGATINPTVPSVVTGARYVTCDVTVTTNPTLVANSGRCTCVITVIGK
jgi:hypothetical protein